MSARRTPPMPTVEDIHVIGGSATPGDLDAVLAAVLATRLRRRDAEHRRAPRIPRPRLERTLVPR